MQIHSSEEIELAEKVCAIYPDAHCVHEFENERSRYRIEAAGKQWPLAADPAGAWSAVLRDFAQTLQRLQGNPRREFAAKAK